jgi:hypothetical protein
VPRDPGVRARILARDEHRQLERVDEHEQATLPI